MSLEAVSYGFYGSVAYGKYFILWDYEVDDNFFHPFWDRDSESAGFRYGSDVYGEELRFSSGIRNDCRIFWTEKSILTEKNDDSIVDYWIQGFKASEKKEIFSVCYRFASGAVLQVADLYEIYGKAADAMHPHKYRVVRMFFVGNKYKKYFPKAYFETEANIQHYKQLMKAGKGWVQQANGYIEEKEVKKEKPVLDYRSNPDYYKPLSQRGK